MNDEILVSIPVITYNQKEYLKECIESILSQDYSNIEIVVADDCSTDGTQEMLKEYDRKYPNKFKLLLSEVNQGVTKNCNLAYFACKGKYIFFMGGDDLMLPNKISTQVEYMEKHDNCTISYHNLDVFFSETNETIKLFNSSKNSFSGNVSISILNGTFNGACSTVVRTEKKVNTGFDERIPMASDWLMWIETLANGGEIHYIDKVLGRYRRHNKNITSIKHDNSEQFMTLAIVEAKYPHLIHYVRKKRSKMYYSLGIEKLLDKDIKLSNKYFIESILSDFTNIKAYIRLIGNIFK
ncbi:glycosyltransferase [Aliarcobacter butzleri]|uniref:glycosyltransferase n=1 Tax=Aliarcobacter butzleri TaxID=28197 RepID=UPI00214B3E2D|nr:glycosyltransferase [Aliarcobacter butzleri]MCP3650034.1 glycosyltransferase [Arcobacter sp. DNRA7]MCR1816207.1 glycosyltransferase [Aliarcobacter butzleri]